MRLYLIRHGESETNLNKCWTGWLDARLTESGKSDALNAKDFLNGVSFDKVFSSDLSRASMTAKIALPQYDAETTPVLREISVGGLEGTPIATVDKALLVGGFTSFGGESHAQLRERVRLFLGMIENLECETVAAFTHGGFLRAVLDEVFGIVLPRKKIRCANCAIAVLSYNDGEWVLDSWINTK